MIEWQRPSTKPWLRSIAFVTLLTFIVTNISWADGTLATPKQVPAVATPQVVSASTIKDLKDQFLLPDSFGQIKKSFQGSRDKIIIHIQDAHANEEAQRNISNILDYFAKKQNLKLISLEGAEGDLYSQFFSFYPSKEARQNVADYFLKAARLTGPEYLAIVERPDVHLYGVEDRAIYDENRKAYLDALEFKDRDEKALQSLGKALNDVSRFVFSDELREINRRRSSFQDGGRELVGYVRYLVDTAEKHNIALHDYAGMHSLLSLIEAEKKIDFDKAEKDIEELTNDLKKIISHEKLSKFITNTVQFRMKKMKRSDYYGYLQEEIKSASTNQAADTEAIDLTKKYQNVLEYLEYMKLYDSIDVSIFDEIEELEKGIKNKLFSSPEEVELDRLFRIYDVYQKMFDFTLTKQDSDFFYNYRDSFNMATFKKFLDPALTKYKFGYSFPDDTSILDQDLDRIERFYAAAIKRDAILIERAVEKMEASGEKISAIVTGGFHTAGIERYLKEHDYSYIVIAPKIAKAINAEKDSKLYQDALAQKPLPLEKRLTEAFFAPKSGLLNDPRFQLAAWHMFVSQEATTKALQSGDEASPLRAFSLLVSAGSILEPNIEKGSVRDTLQELHVDAPREIKDLLQTFENSTLLAEGDVHRLYVYSAQKDSYDVFALTDRKANHSESVKNGRDSISWGTNQILNVAFNVPVGPDGVAAGRSELRTAKSKTAIPKVAESTQKIPATENKAATPNVVSKSGETVSKKTLPVAQANKPAVQNVSRKSERSQKLSTSFLTEADLSSPAVINKEVENASVARSEVRGENEPTRRTFMKIISTVLSVVTLAGPVALNSTVRAAIQTVRSVNDRFQVYVQWFNQYSGVKLDIKSVIPSFSRVLSREKKPKQIVKHISEQKFNQTFPLNRRGIYREKANEFMHVRLGLSVDRPDVFSVDDWAEKIEQIQVTFDTLALRDPKRSRIPTEQIFMDSMSEAIDEAGEGLQFKLSIEDLVESAKRNYLSTQPNASARELADLEKSTRRDFEKKIEGIKDDSEIPQFVRDFLGFTSIDEWVELNKDWQKTELGKKLNVNLDTFLGTVLILTMAKYNAQYEELSGAKGVVDYKLWGLKDHKKNFFADLYLVLNRNTVSSSELMNAVATVRDNLENVVSQVFLRNASEQTDTAFYKRSGNVEDWIEGPQDPAQGRSLFPKNFQGRVRKEISQMIGASQLAKGIMHFVISNSSLWAKKFGSAVPRRGSQILSDKGFDIVKANTAALVQLMNNPTLDQLYQFHDDPILAEIFQNYKNGKYIGVLDANGNWHYPRVITEAQINEINLDRLNPDGQFLVRSLRSILAQNKSTTGFQRDAMLEDMDKEFLKFAVGLYVGRAMSWIRYGFEADLIKVKQDASGALTSIDMSALYKRLSDMNQLLPYVEIFIGKHLNLNYTKDIGTLSGMAQSVDEMELNIHHFGLLLFLASDIPGIEKVMLESNKVGSSVPQERRQRLAELLKTAQENEKNGYFKIRAENQELLFYLAGIKKFDPADPDTGAQQIGFILSQIIQRIVVGWQKTEGRAQSVIELLKKVPLAGIAKEANQYWNAYGRAFKIQVNPITSNFFGMNSKSQGRLMIYMQDAAQEGNWESWTQVSKNMISRFEEYAADPAKLDRDIAALNEDYRAQFGPNYKPVSVQPKEGSRAIVEDQEAEGLFISWLRDKVAASKNTTGKLVPIHNDDMTAQKRSEVRKQEPAKEGTSFTVSRRGFLGAIAGAAVTLSASGVMANGVLDRAPPVPTVQASADYSKAASTLYRELAQAPPGVSPQTYPQLPIEQFSVPVATPNDAVGEFIDALNAKDKGKAVKTMDEVDREFRKVMNDTAVATMDGMTLTRRQELIRDALVIQRAQQGKSLNITKADILKADEVNPISQKTLLQDDQELQGIMRAWGRSRLMETFDWEVTRGRAQQIAQIVAIPGFEKAIADFIQALYNRKADFSKFQDQGVKIGLANSLAKTPAFKTTSLSDALKTNLVARINQMTRLAPIFIVRDNPNSPDLAASKAGRMYTKLTAPVNGDMGYALDNEDHLAMGWLIGELGYSVGLSSSVTIDFGLWSDAFIKERVEKRHQVLEKATQNSEKKEAERILALISNNAERKLDIRVNPADLGFLLNWVESKMQAGENTIYSKTLADRYERLFNSKVFSEYLKAIGFSNQFRQEMASYFSEIEKQARGEKYDIELISKFYDFMGYVSFYVGQYEDVAQFEKILTKKLNILNEIQKYSKTNSDPSSVLQKMFKALTLSQPVQLNGTKATNVYDLNEDLYLIKKKRKYKNEGRDWNDKAIQEEKTSFKRFFLEMQLGIIDRMTERYQTSVAHWLESHEAIFELLKGYPIDLEYDTRLSQKFKNFLEEMKEERVLTDDEIVNQGTDIQQLENYFKFNQMQVAASQWFARMHEQQPYDHAKLTLDEVKAKIDARSKTWKLYKKLWEPIGLVATTGQISYIAEIEWRQEAQREDLFKTGVLIFQLYEEKLGRKLAFDNLINAITLHIQESKIWHRSLGGRSDFISNLRIKSKFLKKDQSDPNKFARMLEYASIDDIVELYSDDWTENLRFVLWNFGKKMKMVPPDPALTNGYYDSENKDQALRAFLMDVIGKGTDADRQHFLSLLDSVEKVPNDIETSVFGPTPIYDPAYVETEKGLREFAIRHLSYRPHERVLTDEERKMEGRQYIDYLVEKFLYSQEPIERAKEKNLFSSPDREFMYTLIGKTSREHLKAMFNDTAVLYDRLVLPNGYRASINKNMLFRIVVEERMNGNVPWLAKMKYETIHYFMDQLHRGEPTPLKETELTSLPREQINNWISEYGLTKVVPNALSERLSNHLAAGLIDRRSVKRLLQDLAVLIEIFERNKMTILNRKNEITLPVLYNLIRTIDDVHMFGLQDSGFIEKQPAPKTWRGEDIKNEMDSATAFDATRRSEDEIYIRFRLYNENYKRFKANRPESIGDITSNMEADRSKGNVEQAKSYAGQILLGLSVWTAFGMLRAFFFHWNQRKTAHTIRDPYTKEVIGTKKIAREKVATMARGMTNILFGHDAGIVIQVAGLWIAYLYVIDWANSYPLFAVIASYLYARISISGAQVIMNRWFTLKKSEPHQRRVRIEGESVIGDRLTHHEEIVKVKDKIPANKKTVIKVPSNNDNTSAVVNEILWRIGNSVLLDYDPPTMAELTKRLSRRSNIFEQYQNLLVRAKNKKSLKEDLETILLSSTENSYIRGIVSADLVRIYKHDGKGLDSEQLKDLMEVKKMFKQFLDPKEKPEKKKDLEEFINKEAQIFINELLSSNNISVLRKIISFSVENSKPRLTARNILVERARQLNIHSDVKQIQEDLGINLVGLFHDTADRSDADIELIHQTIEDIESILGVTIHYWPRNFPAAFWRDNFKINLEKKIGSIDESDHLMAEGQFYPLTDAQKYFQRQLPIQLFYWTGLAGGIVSFGLFFLGGWILAATGMGVTAVAMIIGAFIYTGATQTYFQDSRATRPVLKTEIEVDQVDQRTGEVHRIHRPAVLADMTFYGFAHADYSELLRRYEIQYREYLRQQRIKGAARREFVVDHPQILIALRNQPEHQNEDLRVWERDYDALGVDSRYQAQVDAFVAQYGEGELHHFAADSKKVLALFPEDEREDVNISHLMHVNDLDDNFNRVFAVFIRDDKNHSGYISDDDGVTIVTTGREAGIREAIRQALVDRAIRDGKDLATTEQQNAIAEQMVVSIKNSLPGSAERNSWAYQISSDKNNLLELAKINPEALQAAHAQLDQLIVSANDKGLFSIALSMVARRIKENDLVSYNVGAYDKKRAENQDSIIKDTILRFGLVLDERAIDATPLGDFYGILASEGLTIDKRSSFDNEQTEETGYVGDFSDRSNTFVQFLEEYHHYQPTRKAIEVMSHPENQFAGYGNVFIEIAGKSTEWQESQTIAPKIGTFFDEHMKTVLSGEDSQGNRGVDNEYGKAVQIPNRTVRGTEGPSGPGTPGLYLLGTWAGIATGVLIGLTSGVPFFGIAAGWIAAGFWGYGLMYLGGAIGGAFEGSFYAGETGIVGSRWLSHDSTQASAGLSISLVRAGVIEPAVKDIDDHVQRAPKRWSRGEMFHKLMQYAPGIKMASRKHHFMARKMYVAGVQFLGFLFANLILSITVSGFADVYIYGPRFLEFARPILALYLLAIMAFSIIFVVNFLRPLSGWIMQNKTHRAWTFISGASTAAALALQFPLLGNVVWLWSSIVLTFTLALVFVDWHGYAESYEKNQVSAGQRVIEVMQGTLVFLGLPLIETFTFVGNKWRAMIVSLEPREDTSAIPLSQKVTAWGVGLASIPLMLYVPSLFAHFSTPSVFTYLGFHVLLSASPAIVIPILLAATLWSYYLQHHAPALVAGVLLVASAYLPVAALTLAGAPYTALAIFSGIYLGHRLSGRFMTFAYLITGVFGGLAIGSAPLAVVLFFTGDLSRLINGLITQSTNFNLDSLGLPTLDLSNFPHAVSAITILISIALLSALFYIPYYIFWFASGVLKDPLPWGSFLSVGMSKFKGLYFFAKTFRPAPFFAAFLISASTFVWSNQWSLVFTSPLVVSWGIGFYLAWKMSKSHKSVIKGKEIHAGILTSINKVIQIIPLPRSTINKVYNKVYQNKLVRIVRESILFGTTKFALFPIIFALRVIENLVFALYYGFLNIFASVFLNWGKITWLDTKEGWQLLKDSKGKIAKSVTAVQLLRNTMFSIGFAAGLVLMWGLLLDLCRFYMPAQDSPLIPAITIFSYVVASVVSVTILPFVFAGFFIWAPVLTVVFFYQTVLFFMGHGFTNPFELTPWWAYLFSPALYDLFMSSLSLAVKPGEGIAANFRNNWNNFWASFKNWYGGKGFQLPVAENPNSAREEAKIRKDGRIINREIVDNLQARPLPDEMPNKWRITSKALGNAAAIIATLILSAVSYFAGEKPSGESAPALVVTKPMELSETSKLLSIPELKKKSGQIESADVKSAQKTVSAVQNYFNEAAQNSNPAVQIVNKNVQEFLNVVQTILEKQQEKSAQTIVTDRIQTEVVLNSGEYFKDGRGLIRVTYAEGKNALIPVDRINPEGLAHAFNRDTRYSQPLVLGMWLNILSQQVEGSIPPTVANPREELTKYIQFLKDYQEKYGVVWIQLSSNGIKKDPREIVGFEDWQFATQLANAAGALLNKSDVTEDPAEKKSLLEDVETINHILQGMKSHFRTLVDPATGTFVGDYNIVTRKAQPGRIVSRNDESRALLAFVISYYNAKPVLWTNAPFTVGEYTDRNGKTFPVFKTSDGGAFQTAFNINNGIELKYPHMRTLYQNTLAAYIDQWVVTGGHSYFPGATFVGDLYVKKAGIKKLANTSEALLEDIVVVQNGLNFAPVNPEVVLNLNEYVASQPKLRNSILNLPYESAYVNPKGETQVTPEHTAIETGNALLAVSDMKNPGHHFERFVQSVPGMDQRLNDLYAPKNLGIDADIKTADIAPFETVIKEMNAKQATVPEKINPIVKPATPDTIKLDKKSESVLPTPNVKPTQNPIRRSELRNESETSVAVQNLGEALRVPTEERLAISLSDVLDQARAEGIDAKLNALLINFTQDAAVLKALGISANFEGPSEYLIRYDGKLFGTQFITDAVAGRAKDQKVVVFVDSESTATTLRSMLGAEVVAQIKIEAGLTTASYISQLTNEGFDRQDIYQVAVDDSQPELMRDASLGAMKLRVAIVGEREAIPGIKSLSLAFIIQGIVTAARSEARIKASA